uniref:phosphatidylserine decarboxylase n=1 Tax=Magnetospirillum molischianum TaxID=1083 RepID=UPI003898F104
MVIRPQTPGGKLATQPALLGINREGWLFVAAGLVGWLVLGHIWGFLGTLSLLFALWCAWFFRDPKRVVPVRPGLVISPADGVVQTVEQAVPPAELGFGPTPRPVVRVFMNVFNVHVNRIPADGTVARTAYRPGKFFDASLDKASEHNERVAVRLTLEDGRDIAFVQIAGLVTRRISNGLKDGQKVKAGERFGLIRFGSRLDIYLPEGAKPLVVVGQTAIAGETVLADLKSAEPARIGSIR